MTAVFINYRNDSAAWAVVIDRELSERFGGESVFRAPRSIRPGEDFEERLLAAVGASAILLAIVGPGWLDQDGDGRRRIDAVDDWVRREIAAAFTAGVPVVPILVDDTPRLSAERLPADIERLSRCQYLRLHHRNAGYDLRRIGDELAGLVPRLARRDRRRSIAGVMSLPRVVTSFTGRESELAAIRAAAAKDRIVTVAGKPGVGKSALVVQAAHMLTPDHPDGQVYVDLRGMRPDPLAPDAACRAILHALGEESGDGDEQDLFVQYQMLLKRSRAILVLDDAVDEAQVRPLLPATGRCLVLVTSRRPLLTLLEAPPPLMLDVLDEHDAHALLVSIVGGTRLAVEQQAIAEVIQHCGGLPLALRIVAGRLRSRPQWKIAAFGRRLRDEKRRLDELRFGDLEVRASISLSYLELDSTEAVVLRCLSAITGPDFGLETAGAASAMEPAVVERVIDQLVDAQLLEVHSAVRFYFHDLIRLFAHEQLTPEEGEQATGRIVAAYTTRVAIVGEALGITRRTEARELEAAADPGTEQSPAEWLRMERRNLYAALRAATDPAQTWELAHALLPCLEQTAAHVSDLRDVANTARRAALALDDEAILMIATCHQGRILRRCGDYAGSARALEKGARYFLTSGQDAEAAKALFWLALTAREHGRIDRAIEALSAAFDLHVRTGDHLAAAGLLIEIAVILKEQRHLREAASLLEWALRVLEPSMTGLGDERRVAWAHENLGAVLKRLGRLREAATHHHASLQAFRRLHLAYGEALAVRNIGDLAMLSGRPQVASPWYEQSLVLFVGIGDRPGEAQALAGLTSSLARERRWGRALWTLLRYAVTSWRSGSLRKTLSQMRSLTRGPDLRRFPSTEPMSPHFVRLLRDPSLELLGHPRLHPGADEEVGGEGVGSGDEPWIA